MVRGSDTLLGSDGNPLPLLLLDAMAGDGMLNSGGGVSGTLEEWEEHAPCLNLLRLWKEVTGGSPGTHLGVETVALGVLWPEFWKRPTCDEHRGRKQ